MKPALRFRHSARLALAIISTLAASSAGFAGESRRISVPDEFASPGTDLQIPVLLDNAAGLASIQLRINFNPQLLRLRSVTPGALGDAFGLDSSAADGVIQLLFTRESNLAAGSGRLAILTFTLNSGADPDSSSNIAVAEARFGDESSLLDLAATDQIAAVNGHVTASTSTFIDNDADGLPDNWETAHGLSMLDADALLDPDGDGISNFLEYALGGNPRAPDDASLLRPTPTTVRIGNQTFLKISFRRLISPPPWLRYTVEESSDFKFWLPLDPAQNQLGSPVDDGDGTETVTVFGTIPMSGPDSESKGFLRTRVENTQP